MMEALEKAEEKVGESSRAEGKGDEDKNAAGDDDLSCPICMDFFIDVRAVYHPAQFLAFYKATLLRCSCKSIAQFNYHYSPPEQTAPTHSAASASASGLKIVAVRFVLNVETSSNKSSRHQT